MSDTPMFDLMAAQLEVAPDAPEAPRVGDELTAEQVLALPIGSVVMATTRRSFGVYEQRVWMRYGGEPGWQFGNHRHEWQSTDGGFQRVEDAQHPPVFTWNRAVTLLHIGAGAVG